MESMKYGKNWPKELSALCSLQTMNQWLYQCAETATILNLVEKLYAKKVRSV